ncbi:MAG: 1,6-anhydro-N-acetylmuramyl-L-alanine amidase AmpD [Oceanospirillaceae bacterium]|nr:1,6-anhydro-N-acetylmuramyl-L-alanine amidase AmpD [Oceanospirillaceae bacterium]
MAVDNGRYSEAVWVPSPNFGPRPMDTEVRLIVVHNISLPPGEFGGGYVQGFFQNDLPVDDHAYFQTIAELQVSAHLFIERTGKVTQFVSFEDRAWHAGVSEWNGCANCNDFSIGIELEGTDDTPYTAAQYAALAEVIRQLRQAYPAIAGDAITGHEHIAPGRKTDPGPAFDWDRLFHDLRQVKE